MAALTYDEIQRLANNAANRAGYVWNFNEGPGLMAAIALAESSGDPSRINDNKSTGDLSYGLWQINMIGKLGPARRKQFKISKNEELLDPKKNADAMIKILKGQGLNAWSTYKSGAYKKYAHGKLDFDGGPIADKASDVASAVPDAIRGFGNALAEGLFKLGINFGAISLAFIFLILGVVVLSRTSVSKVAKVAAKVVT